MAESKYTKGVLAKMTVRDLRSTAEDEGIDTDELNTKALLIDALLELELEDEIDDEEELDDEVDDEEEDDIEADEVDDEPAPPAAKKTRAAAKPAESAEGVVVAKQVATLLGTEAKTLRQFFRSSASTVEPVGSGGRYEFDEADVPKIKAEFDAWKAGHASRGSKRTGEASTRTRGKRGPKVAEITEVEEVEELEIEGLEDEELDDTDLELEEADDEEED